MSADDPANRKKQALVKRRPDGTFEPGQSGNMSGRPRALVEVVRLAREATGEAIKELRRIAKKSKSDSARVAAAQALLDRGWGKAPQTINIDETPAPVKSSMKFDLNKLSDEEFKAYEMFAAALKRMNEESE